MPSAPHETLLVLDAGIGQNNIAQAKKFNEEVGITGIVLTKLDGSAKGGAIFPLCGSQDSISMSVSEKAPKICMPFDRRSFVEALFSTRRRRRLTRPIKPHIHKILTFPPHKFHNTDQGVGSYSAVARYAGYLLEPEPPRDTVQRNSIHNQRGVMAFMPPAVFVMGGSFLSQQEQNGGPSLAAVCMP